MNILFANTSHIPGMIRLLDQVGQVHHDIRPDIFCDRALKYDASALEALLKDPARPIFVAVAENFVQGYCFCIHQITEGNPVLMDRKNLYIDDLCVDEACRGQGIAAALYAYALDYARKEGFDAITLNVWSGNSAERFYQKMGLKPQKVGMEAILEEA